MHRIKVKVNAGARSEGVRRLAEAFYQVRTRAPAVAGKANRRVLELLAQELGLAARDLEIVAGKTSRVKWVAVKQ